MFGARPRYLSKATGGHSHSTQNAELSVYQRSKGASGATTVARAKDQRGDRDTSYSPVMPSCCTVRFMQSNIPLYFGIPCIQGNMPAKPLRHEPVCEQQFACSMKLWSRTASPEAWSLVRTSCSGYETSIPHVDDVVPHASLLARTRR